jgi:hypothetical protein
MVHHPYDRVFTNYRLAISPFKESYTARKTRLTQLGIPHFSFLSGINRIGTPTEPNNKMALEQEGIKVVH